MSATKIEWTERTWNPVTGCTKVSPGCDNCYAEGIARRFAGSKAFPNGFDVTLHPERLEAPLRWRKPARVFVNSMSDLFHDAVPDDFIAWVWAVMAAAPQHTFQILTKRHGRMRSLLGNPDFSGELLARAWFDTVPDGHRKRGLIEWPLPNVWLGTSVEDQKRAELRIPALLNTPAAVRFLSCEPLLGPVDLTRIELLAPRPPHGPGVWLDALRGHVIGPDDLLGVRIGWVIVGGESGPGARPMQLDWAGRLVTQCRAANVPVFVKQLGSAFGRHKGGDMDMWPADLRVRDFPAVAA